VIDHGCHAKFDEIAAAEPYPFVGATARCDAEILIKTIDMMVKSEQRSQRRSAHDMGGKDDSLKSHSATDVSELAFKYYGEI
jgi:hypothetical protein